MKQVEFIQMKDGTAEEYACLGKLEVEYISSLPQRLMLQLEALGDSLEGYKVSRLEHSLQSATRAEVDGCGEEMVVATLLHDIGDLYSPANHAEYAAAVLRPYVHPDIVWVIEKHGEFQMYYWAHHLGKDRNTRDKYKEHPLYQTCIDFCEKYDQNSFDPAYPSKPLSHFEPMVQRVMGRPKYPV